MKNTKKEPSIRVESIPKFTQNALAVTLIDAAKRAFADPGIAKEYEDWKKRRS